MTRPRPITGQGPHAVAICEALGIDPATCVSIEFRMHVREVVTVKVERLVLDPEARALAVVLERFNLVPRDDDGPTALADAAIRKAFA